jgi:hypothetical protein
MLMPVYMAQNSWLPVYWININKPTGLWKIHKDTCRFSKPQETKNKGVNELKIYGFWVQAGSFEEGYRFYEQEHGINDYWQPCRECKPE